MYRYKTYHVFYFKPFKLVITNKTSPKTKKGSHCFKSEPLIAWIVLWQFVSMFIHLFRRFVRSDSFSINLELINNECALCRYLCRYVCLYGRVAPPAVKAALCTSFQPYLLLLPPFHLPLQSHHDIHNTLQSTKYGLALWVVFETSICKIIQIRTKVMNLDMKRRKMVFLSFETDKNHINNNHNYLWIRFAPKCSYLTHVKILRTQGVLGIKSIQF